MGVDDDLVDERLGPAPTPTDLVGLAFNGLAFAADMAMFDFGPLSPHTLRYGARKGKTIERGSHALHVQCAWRWQHKDDMVTSHRNPTGADRVSAAIGSPVAEARMDTLMGDLAITFASGHLLLVFPNNADAENWRLLAAGGDTEHLVWRDRED